MKLILLLLVLFQLSFPLCLSHLPRSLKAEDITGDEYAVYSALIQKMYVKEGVKTVVVGKQTLFYKVDWEKPEDYRKSIFDGLSPVSEETIEDFERKNEVQGELTRQLNLTLNYVVLGEKKSSKTTQEYETQWREFYEKYPNSPGIISVSRVGFNSRRDQAIVYVANSCGELCGKGHYVFLITVDDIWTVEKDMLLWVS